MLTLGTSVGVRGHVLCARAHTHTYTHMSVKAMCTLECLNPFSDFGFGCSAVYWLLLIPWVLKHYKWLK